MRISDWSSDVCSSDLTAIVPTRPRKPRDKAKVEAAVLIVERWILARLRDRRFFSLAELNAAIRELVGDLNARLMRKLGASRREFFERIDRPALLSLPAARSEEHTSELQSLMRISYAVFCLKKKKTLTQH